MRTRACAPIPLAAALLLVAWVAGGCTTRAAFTDRASSGGSSVGAATLAGAEGLWATPGGGASPSVHLEWTPAFGTFATSWQVLRTTGDCSLWAPGDGDVWTETPALAVSDWAVGVGGRYCYSVRGRFGNWTSVALPPVTVSFETVRLYPTSGGVLGPWPGSGSQSFTCTTELLGLCILPGVTTLTWQSAEPHALNTAAGWSVSLEVTLLSLISLGSPQINLTAWYAPGGSCGTPPSTGQLIASGSVTVSAAGTTTTNLTPNASFEPPSGDAPVCLGASVEAAFLSLLRTLTISNGAATFIEGPIAP